MSKTLQQKIDTIFSDFDKEWVSVHDMEDSTNKALQEFREQIEVLPCEECKPDNCYQNAPLILKSKVLALLGEKNE